MKENLRLADGTVRAIFQGSRNIVAGAEAGARGTGGAERASESMLGGSVVQGGPIPRLPNEPQSCLKCPECGCQRLYRDGMRYLADGSEVQRWLCRDCAYRFSERRLGDPAGAEKPLQEKFYRSLKGPGSISGTRQICALEAKNLSSAAETKTVAGEEGRRQQDIRGKLVEFSFFLKKEGKAEDTILTYVNCLRRMARHSSLDDPESVKEYLAKLEKANNTKANYRVAYTAFLHWQGRTWKAPRYMARSPIPEFIPTEQEIDQLISGSGKKTAAILQAIKETGMRIGETVGLKWTALNDKGNTLTLNDPAKHGLPRMFKISPRLVMILQSLAKTHERIFGVTTAKDAQRSFARARRKIAVKVGNPRLARIHFHLIRHWKGTMEYHKTHDIDHVRRLLGHRSVLPTQIYVNMEQVLFTGDANEYHVKAVSTVEEASALIEVGFEYVTDIEDKKLFRKRK